MFRKSFETFLSLFYVFKTSILHYFTGWCKKVNVFDLIVQPKKTLSAALLILTFLNLRKA